MTLDLPAGNIAATLDFLLALPHETINLVAIEPDAENVHGITRAKGSPDLEAFVRRWNGRHNLYFSANEPRADAPDTKLRKAHLARIHFVFADLDAGKGEDFAAGRRRLEHVAGQLVGHPIAPATFVLDSGGGYQPFWQIPAMPATPENIALVEAQGRGIAVALGGDNTFDANRIMRLPGTVNLPDAKKRERGRVAAEARVWGTGPAECDLGDVAAAWAPAAAPKKEGDQVDAKAIGLDLAKAREFDTFDDLPAELRQQFAFLHRRRPDFADLWEGRFAGFEDTSRSGQLYRLAGFLKGNGFDVNDYGRLAWVWDHGYAADWADMDDWRAARTLARAWGNWDGGEVGLRGAPLAAEVFDVLPADAGEIPVAGAVRRGPLLKPFAFRDPASFPKRDWIYGKIYVRGFVSALVAPGGVGKSSLALVEAVAMATGRPLLGIAPERRQRVAYFNGEDPMEEVERRAIAICLFYEVPPEEVEGWLFIGSGREHGLTLMKLKDGSAKVCAVDVKILSDAIAAEQLDLVILDPFVSMHAVGENSNENIDAVCKLLGSIATEQNCAFGVVHHVRKGGSGPRVDTQVEDARGAGALINGTRSARVLNRMSPEEAKRLGISDSARWLHFRADNGKANMAPPAEGADWFKLHSVALGNGDDVGVVAAWQLPTAAADISDEQATEILDAITGGKSRAHSGATDWAGAAVADVLGWNLADRGEKTRAEGVLRTFLTLGILKRVDVKEPKKGKTQPHYHVIRQPDPGELSFFETGEEAADDGSPT